MTTGSRFRQRLSPPVGWGLLAAVVVLTAGALGVASRDVPQPLLLGIAVPHATPAVSPEGTPPIEPTATPSPQIKAVPTPTPEIVGVKTSPTPTPKVTRVVYVSTAGSDAADRGTKEAPWRTISYALQQATPGTEIAVQPGTYSEHITTAKDGTAAQPITVRAAGNVVLAGSGEQGRIMEVLHDYHVIQGFEFKDSDILLWLQEADHTTITGNYFHHAQGECVRVKYQSSNNIFEGNRVEYCGREDFGGGGDGKNGEGVYLGTAPEQLGKNPTGEIDRTNGNIVRRNTFNTHGNECVDIKEGAEQNVVEFNDCTGQLDVESGGMDSRGNRNVFRYNKIYGNKGAGIRFGGDEDSDGIQNEAYGNDIAENAREAIKVTREPQGQVCGNTVRDNAKGLSNKESITNPSCPFKLLPAGV